MEAIERRKQQENQNRGLALNGRYEIIKCTFCNILGRCSTLFDVNNVKSAFQAVLKRRPNNLRTFLLVLASCFLLEIFLITGKGPTMYLYFRRKYSWNNKVFGAYIGLFGILGLCAQYILLPFMSNKLKLHDMTIGK